MGGICYKILFNFYEYKRRRIIEARDFFFFFEGRGVYKGKRKRGFFIGGGVLWLISKKYINYKILFTFN